MIELYSGIYEIPDFLTDQELTLLNEYVNGVSESDWFAKNSHGMFIEVDRPDVQEALEAYRSRVQAMFFGHGVLPIKRITRISQGKKMDGHTDLGEPRCVHGVVLYLNDDFVGGELHYKDIGVRYKPRAGSIIVHEAKYFHEVLPVESGVRYSATTFVWKSV